MEITQFTYFQLIGSQELNPISVELTYGLERIAMYIQGVENVYDLAWNDKISYGDIHHRNEVEFSYYNFQASDTALYFQLFDKYEEECQRVLAFEKESLVLPAYDFVLKCSHVFNLLDARSAISVSERVAYITRVRNLARLCAVKYLEVREKLGYPLLHKKSDG
jgi:glycyl-tRNA synthetase alpha chain